MRNARSPFSPTRRIWIAAMAAALCVCGMGCHQHHYYYGAPGALAVQGYPSSVIAPGAIVEGPICEVPSAVDGGTVVSSRSTTIDGGRKQSRVVISEPAGRSSSSRIGWRSYNPEDVPAITRVEGALDSSVK